MKKENIWKVLSVILMWAFSILVLYPLLMIVITSFKSKGEASYLNIALPKVFHFENYQKVVENGFFQSLLNSCIVTVVSMFLTITCSTLLAYIIVRRDTKGVRILYRVITLGIVAPFAAMPTIRLLQTLHLYGSHIGLCLVNTALNMPYTVMITRSYLKGIPREIDEAAVIDGAAGMTLFWKIIFPLLKPVMASALIVNFMWTWNDLQTPIYLLNSSKKYTLPLSIYSFIGQFSSSWNLVCADIVLVSIPVVLVYVFCQKLVIDGMTAGSVKE